LLLYALSSTHTISGVTGGVVLAGIGWIGRLVFCRERRITQVTLFPLFFLLAILASTLWSGHIVTGLDRLLSHAGKVLLFYILALETFSRARLRWLARMLVTGALIAVVYEAVMLGAGRSSLAVLADNRALGGMLGMLIPFSFTLFPVELNRIWKVLTAVSLCLMVVFLVLSSTRGAWAGCLVAMLFLGVVAERRAIWIVLLAVFLFFLVSPRAQVTRAVGTFGSNDKTIAKRTHLWKSGLRMAEESPVFGEGPGSYRTAYTGYLSPEGSRLVRHDHAHAHNIFIHTLAETGIVGLSTLVLLLIVIFRRVWRLQRSLTDAFLKALVSGVIGGLLVFLIHGQVDYTLAGRTGYLFWFYAGFAFQCGRLGRST
jgi:O-antigen ligase